MSAYTGTGSSDEAPLREIFDAAPGPYGGPFFGIAFGPGSTAANAPAQRGPRRSRASNPSYAP